MEETCRTLNGVADSGFIWTIGAIRTTPANSVGRLHAVRMEIAPPWKGTRRELWGFFVFFLTNEACKRNYKEVLVDFGSSLLEQGSFPDTYSEVKIYTNF